LRSRSLENLIATASANAADPARFQVVIEPNLRTGQ
jgi:hypothetical protein